MTESLKKLMEERKKTNDYNVETAIQMQGQARFEHGLKKYGQTLDRNDLMPIEWLQHFKEEMMDGIRYCERIQRELEKNNYIKMGPSIAVEKQDSEEWKSIIMNDLEKQVWTEAFIHGLKDYAQRGSPSGAKNHSDIASQYADEVLKEYRKHINEIK